MHAIHAAYSDMDATLETVAMDELAVLLEDGLLANDKFAHRTLDSLTDLNATNRAKEYFDGNLDQTILSGQLEKVTGLDRFWLTRQFSKVSGTNLYRYLTMRRLVQARGDIAARITLVDTAMRAGFSDQSHLTRRFKATFERSPGQVHV